MIVVHNHLGGIEFTRDFFVSLISTTAENCFGVSAMNASSAKERVAELIPEFGRFFKIPKGVHVRVKDGKVRMSIHISVMYGVNISAVVSSIRNKLRYAVEEQTQLPVESIDVYIDGLTA
ncbi:MAG: Asp23/Gls24 family envelope stress response protein [Ruminiclostridium sp.]|nr:Asp23/Gls24 family envelope stress response protein [Ruminiclostridium sp.]